MDELYVASAFLTVKDSRVAVVFDCNHRKAQLMEDPLWLTILEVFIHERSLQAAYERFQCLHDSPLPARGLRRQYLQSTGTHSPTLLVRVAAQSLQVDLNGSTLDFSALSKETCQVLTTLACLESSSMSMRTVFSFEQFRQAVHHLVALGALSPAVGAIDWGNLRRTSPLCHLFGLTRGTPIDRYYLRQFVSEIRSEVRGTVLEVGGELPNRELYQFENAVVYHTLDIAQRPGVTQVGDVHEPDTMRAGSLDAVVLFNVLEHCHDPWAVVKNIHRWLRVNGKCFCMVPSAQRLHDFPKDYWRPLPEGMRQLFAGYAQRRLYVYGNPQTVMASFLGIAAEELSGSELDDRHPDYPVATCMVAIK